MTDTLIIIPAHNEEKNILKVLEDIKTQSLNMDVLIVDDGSKDKTRDLVMSEEVKIISHPYNLGYGAALQTGFKYAKKQNYKYVILFDGDGQHNAKYIKDFYEEISKNHWDIVSGSRFLVQDESEVELLKKIVIRALRKIIFISTGVKITDPTCGFKALSQRAYEFYSKMGNYPADYPDSDIIIQMLKLGYKIKEIPISINKRIHGTSMHSGLKPIIYLFKMFLSINVVLLRHKLQRREELE
ncbi:glycosyltransferase family 2 protein [Clostridium swellfunianum]|uniref:glycosyltransferase family 2 protein n=1 Tax=Clostridium swellfunianum TaxID=1367462 RepID=UPI0020301414|nr:glycosyltransferase family 2 protein [Clostridium swellfunianum]MCM0647210.1 glycosyltransferase family 2 protein [Clostridium swellfunianum]